MAKKRRVLIVDHLSDNAQALLKKKFDVVYDPGLNGADLENQLTLAEALVIRTRTQITEELLTHAPKLKIIVRAGIGLDNVDLNACKKAKVKVKNTPKGNRVSTAEHTLGLIISLVRHIPQARESMQKGVWDRKAYTGMELMGKTLGIIGLGNIGSLVAQKAQALDIRVLAYDPYLEPKKAHAIRVPLVKFDDLLSQSHIVTFHVPLTDETRHMANSEFFAKMKRGSYLINASRGAVVDPKALLGALDSGHLAGAALDVFEEEPLPQNSPLLRNDKIIVTPHVAGQTTESVEKISLEAAQTVFKFLE